MRYKNPSANKISSPKLLDKAIQGLQTTLENLTWLDTVYGQCEHRYTDQGIIPTAYQGNKLDEADLRPNDYIKSHAFFDVQDPVNFSQDDNYNSVSKFVRFDVNIAIIFSVNLERVDRTTDYRVTKMENKREVIDYVNRRNFSSGAVFSMTAMYERDLNMIYQGFDVSDIERKFYMLPWWHMRIEGNLQFQETCRS